MNPYPTPSALAIFWRRQLEMALEAGETPVLALGWDTLRPDSTFALDALHRLARSRPGAVDPWVVAGGEGDLWLLGATQWQKERQGGAIYGGNDSATSREAIAVVEDFFRAMEARDEEKLYALLHDDVVYQNVPLPADRGKAAVERTLRGFERFVTKVEFKLVNIAANGPIVLTERVDILTGPWVHLDLWVYGTFEVTEGKIVLWRDYFDLASAASQIATSLVRKLLGLLPK